MEGTLMTAVRLPKAVREQLDDVAEATNRTRTQVVLDAIRRELEDRPEHADDANAPAFSSAVGTVSEN